MSRQVWYVAHPVAPNPAEAIDDAIVVRLTIEHNIRRALRWLAWLRATLPRVTFIAPWIATLQSLDGDDSPALREAGLVDDCTVVARCEGIALVGGRISVGMAREARSASQVVDLTWLGDEPPSGERISATTTRWIPKGWL